MYNTVNSVTSTNLLGYILLCLVASSATASPLGSTSTPQQTYQEYLKSLAGPTLGTTRAPYGKGPQYPAGSYEAALQAGAILYTKISFYNCFIYVSMLQVGHTCKVISFIPNTFTSVLIHVIKIYTPVHSNIF